MDRLAPRHLRTEHTAESQPAADCHTMSTASGIDCHHQERIAWRGDLPGQSRCLELQELPFSIQVRGDGPVCQSSCCGKQDIQCCNGRLCQCWNALGPTTSLLDHGGHERRLCLNTWWRVTMRPVAHLLVSLLYNRQLAALPRLCPRSLSIRQLACRSGIGRNPSSLQLSSPGFTAMKAVKCIAAASERTQEESDATRQPVLIHRHACATQCLQDSPRACRVLLHHRPA